MAGRKNRPAIFFLQVKIMEIGFPIFLFFDVLLFRFAATASWLVRKSEKTGGSISGPTLSLAAMLGRLTGRHLHY
jgi:hypothetical protein